MTQFFIREVLAVPLAFYIFLFNLARFMQIRLAIVVSCPPEQYKASLASYTLYQFIVYHTASYIWRY